MSPVFLVWLELAACIALIGLAGPELSRSGDVIAAKTRLSASWIGLVLLAAVTSLPELITGISSVTIADAPEIAVGDIFGSCVFNLAILAVLDLVSRRVPFYGRVSESHVLSAGFGVLLIGVAGMNLLIPHRPGFSIGHIGFYTPVILALYAVAMRSIFSYEKRRAVELAEDIADRYPQITLRSAILRYAGASVIVVAAGVWLPFIGADLAEAMGWQRSFVGTLFVAGATSTPEAVVTLAALRLGAVDMAVASLLGSNLFDMAILAVDDIFFRRGPLLSAVSSVHAISAFSAIIMTGLTIIGVLYRPKKLLFQSAGWVSIALLLMYLMNSYLLFQSG